jgi:crotonobetainyl-CoA:carnitine CoA-transferase CaiB-like acyl-CoA transferase
MKTENRALDDIHVLDIAGPIGVYTTKLMADLGADVIRIEQPGGDPMRSIGPFIEDRTQPENSLFFIHYNTGKKSITLNIETEDGSKIFKKLVENVDVIVESFSPGFMERIGLGYAVLRKINPRLILTSVTAFGQTGPYKEFKANDLIGQAMGGILHSLGPVEGPPTALGGNQAYHMASAYAAIGTLIALANRDVTSKGRWVDISMQAAMIRMTERITLDYWLYNQNRKRIGGLEFYRGIRVSFPCRDGEVFCSALGGAGAEAMLQWMESEGMAGDLRDEKYANILKAMQGIPLAKGSQQKTTGSFASSLMSMLNYPEELLIHIEDVWQAFLMTHTKEELFIGAQQRGVRLLPINDVRGVCEDKVLNDRAFFTDIAYPELGMVLRDTGVPYRLSETPWQVIRRAPFIGEHNHEIYQKELGLSDNDIKRLTDAHVI